MTNKVNSTFSVDHTKLMRGIYELNPLEFSNRSLTHSVKVVTYDLRFKAPYKEKAMTSKSIHTIEHLLATFLRENSLIGSDVVYFGPMGCQTGFYLVVANHPKQDDVLKALKEATFKALTVEEVPFANKYQCGNYSLVDLKEAKKDLTDFLVTIDQGFKEYTLFKS
jgi:S-ribosylhomocysteine lyase